MTPTSSKNNPELFIQDVKKKIKFQSRIWRQLRNQMVSKITSQGKGLIDTTNQDVIDSLIAKAREQVRDLIEEAIPKDVCHRVLF